LTENENLVVFFYIVSTELAKRSMPNDQTLVT